MNLQVFDSYINSDGKFCYTLGSHFKKQFIKSQNINLLNIYAPNGTGKTRFSKILLENLGGLKTTLENPILSIQDYNESTYWCHTNTYKTISLNSFFNNEFLAYDKLLIGSLLHHSTPYDMQFNYPNIETDFIFQYYNCQNHLENDTIIANSFFNHMPDFKGFNYPITSKNSFLLAFEFYSSLLKIDILKFLQSLKDSTQFLKMYTNIKKSFNVCENECPTLQSNLLNENQIMVNQFITLRDFFLCHEKIIFEFFSNKINSSLFQDTLLSLNNMNKYIDSLVDSNHLEFFSQIFKNIKFSFKKRYNSIFHNYFYDIIVETKKTFNNSHEFLCSASEGEKNIYNLFKFYINYKHIDYSKQTQGHIYNSSNSLEYLIVSDDLFSSLDQNNIFYCFSNLIKFLNNLNIKVTFINLTHDFNLFKIFSHQIFSGININVNKIIITDTQVELFYSNHNNQNQLQKYQKNLNKINQTSSEIDFFENIYLLISYLPEWRQIKENNNENYSISNPFFHLNNNNFSYNEFFKYFSFKNKYLNIHINKCINDTDTNWIILLSHIYMLIKDNQFSDISPIEPYFNFFKYLIYRKLFEILYYKYLNTKDETNKSYSLKKNKNKKINEKQFKIDNHIDWSELHKFNKNLINENIHQSNYLNYLLYQENPSVTEFFEQLICNYSLKYKSENYKFSVKTGYVGK